MGRGPLSERFFTSFLLANVCGISSAFALLSPTQRHVPTWSSAVRHSRLKRRACDLHALGTPPAFVLSQDQTLHCVLERRLRASPTTNGTERVTCASSRFSCEGTKAAARGQANKKPGVSAPQRRRTPGDVSGHTASAFRKKDEPETNLLGLPRRVRRRRPTTA